VNALNASNNAALSAKKSLRPKLEYANSFNDYGSNNGDLQLKSLKREVNNGFKR